MPIWHCTIDPKQVKQSFTYYQQRSLPRSKGSTSPHSFLLFLLHHSIFEIFENDKFLEKTRSTLEDQQQDQCGTNDCLLKTNKVDNRQWSLKKHQQGQFLLLREKNHVRNLMKRLSYHGGWRSGFRRGCWCGCAI